LRSCVASLNAAHGPQAQRLTPEVAARGAGVQTAMQAPRRPGWPVRRAARGGRAGALRRGRDQRKRADGAAAGPPEAGFPVPPPVRPGARGFGVSTSRSAPAAPDNRRIQCRIYPRMCVLTCGNDVELRGFEPLTPSMRTSECNATDSPSVCFCTSGPCRREEPRPAAVSGGACKGSAAPIPLPWCGPGVGLLWQWALRDVARGVR
jgi:hypothetical protein